MFNLSGAYLNMAELEKKMLVVEHSLIMLIIEKYQGIQNIRPIGNKKNFACGIVTLNGKYTIWYEFRLQDGSWSSGLEQLPSLTEDRTPSDNYIHHITEQQEIN